MNGNHFCYYHRRLHETFILPGHRFYAQPALDNSHGIQLALTQLSAAIGKGLISSKEAKAMSWNIHLAQVELKRVTENARQAKENATPPPQIETEFTGGMRKVLHIDDNKPHASTDSTTAERRDSATNDAPTAGDYRNHPLIDVEGLRPMNDILPAGEAPRWVPMSSEESKFICDNMPPDERTATLRQKFCLRRLRLHMALGKIENPTTQQVLKAVRDVEEEEKSAIEVLNGLDPAPIQIHNGREGARR
jgi:hypothetical protein